MLRSLRRDDGCIELLLLNEFACALQEMRIPEIVAGAGIKNKLEFQSRGDASRNRGGSARVEKRCAISIKRL